MTRLSRRHAGARVVRILENARQQVRVELLCCAEYVSDERPLCLEPLPCKAHADAWHNRKHLEQMAQERRS